MKKIGILEIFVILAILITSGSLIYKYISAEKSNSDLVFDGDQMYKCAWTAEKIINKNFPLYAYVEGKWTSSGEPFNSTVLIIDARGGTLYAIYNNRVITIGGEMAYLEDISAKKIVLKPLGKTILKYQIDPVNGSSFKEIKNKIEKTEKIYNLKIVKTYIKGNIGVDSKTFSPSEQQNILNSIPESFKSSKKSYIAFTDGGLFLRGNMDLDIFNNLDGEIKPKKIITSQLTVYMVLNESSKDIPKNILKYNNGTVVISLN